MGASLPLRQEDTPHGTATWSPREACHFSVRYTSQCDAPALVVVNAQVPGEGPSFNPFATQKPHPGYSVIVYFMITREMASWSSRPHDPDVPRSVGLWLNLLDRGISDRNLPFKVIGRVQNLTDLPSLPAMGIIERYNGKPALITGSATILEGSRPYRYVEIDYDVRKWSLIARTTLAQVKERVRDVVLDVGYLVESQEEVDMPERLLGSISLHHLDHRTAHVGILSYADVLTIPFPDSVGRSTGGTSSLSAEEDNADDARTGGGKKDKLSFESEGRIRHDLDSVGVSSCSAEAWLVSLTADDHGGPLPSLSASTLAATNTIGEGKTSGLLDRLRQWGAVGEFLANDLLAPWSTLDQLSADYAVTSWFLKAPRISLEAASPQWHCSSHPSAPYNVLVSPKGEVTLIDRLHRKVFNLALPKKTPRVTGSCVAFAPSPCPLSIALGTVSGLVITSLSGVHEDWQIIANRSLPVAPSVVDGVFECSSSVGVGHGGTVLGDPTGTEAPKDGGGHVSGLVLSKVLL
ncbi:hypothetical protein Pmar_PMAR018564 [Perkinsus marinus ATCC 50983]|uniref:Protein ENHANCED DISEASE RESISTANCE 2 C-terminal domain-containing protein n=2 Tax=Perkinsus marinus (strain ATCC 50983 / TXsc) TaxID=423536 RepID=C5L062_PERM5|nr:hypothetical protein Pmar_PMAR018564 [Perkinsus marinus ATCC 50983]EER09920.1 hypothetical protein Pmar_PMAR018564 [Perkinsus marinus ATCC 50983]|eukprot:XP_002778125.1 hypothetical protein Pmar_PMAR018564 [Perkinsus marinus ATCC 50983]